MYRMFDYETHNEEIYNFYCVNKNYECCNAGNINGRVIIFFTGHGLYFPTTIEEFRKEVVGNNKYEWKNLSRDPRIVNSSSEYVFVRDVYKNWCIQGISGDVDTQDKLAELLRQIVDGREVVTVGNSAGGYMAILFGILLGASAIYAFSPQINLHEYHKDHPIKYYDKYKETSSVEKYMNLVPLIKEFQGNLFYWFPCYCEEDVRQYNVVKQCHNVCFFAMEQKEHGSTLWGESMVKTLTMSPEKIKHLSKKYEGEVIKPYSYCKDTSGYFSTMCINITKVMKRFGKM